MDTGHKSKFARLDEGCSEADRMGELKKMALIVEDDRWTREAMASILRHRGWVVQVAATVARGLELVEQTTPDCVILDLSLPDGSGEIILRQVREAALPTRVVVCTATHEQGRLEGVRQLEPDAV